jgi:GDP-4-dehydro-6-deoxy-D-mannose reductase
MRDTPVGIPIPEGPVLVTGAGGFVGGHLMEGLGLTSGDAAADAHCGFSAPAGVRKVLWRLPGPPPADIGEFGTVVHLAAMTSVAESRGSVRDVYSVNLMGTLDLLGFVRDRCPRARVLLVSSSEVYAPAGTLLDEDNPVTPRNPYGASKAASEAAAGFMAGESGLQIVTARPFPHYGPGQSGRFALPSFCGRIIRARRSGRKVIAAGNLFPVRDYLHVSDVVRAYAVLLARGDAGRVYNVCSGVGVSMEWMLQTLIRVSGSNVSVETDRSLVRPSDHSSQVGAPGRLMALGWSGPEKGHETGLAELYSWWNRRIE